MARLRRRDATVTIYNCRIKASSIGYGDKEFDSQTLYDQPEVDDSKVRISGPFTVEALSRYAITPSPRSK
jgi:hypothetical protein